VELVDLFYNSIEQFRDLRGGGGGGGGGDGGGGGGGGDFSGFGTLSARPPERSTRRRVEPSVLILEGLHDRVKTAFKLLVDLTG
jgi:hypothetical protein